MPGNGGVSDGPRLRASLMGIVSAKGIVLSAEWVVEGASQKAKCTGRSKERSVKAVASNPEPLVA